MILCDAGPLIAAAVETDLDHHACVELFTGLRLANRELLVPSVVVAEAAFMIQKYGSPEHEALFVDSLANGDFVVIEASPGDYRRAAELMRQYAGFPLGAADATVLALAESLGVIEVATLDRRHFESVRLRHAEYLTLLP
jgi:predicted nucleic acid-binding protein